VACQPCYDSFMTEHQIGTLSEGSLHAALKEWIAQPGDRFEVPVESYVVDVLRSGLIIEIQTGNFTAIRRKLFDLTERYSVRLVYPIPARKWIVRLSGEDDEPISRRRSPLRGTPIHLFKELVRMPMLPLRERFSLELLLINLEQVWRNDGQGSWRRQGWSLADQRLLGVVDRVVLHGVGDYARLLPVDLPDPFTTADLAGALGERRALVQKMAYCLRQMGVIEVADMRGRAYLYRRAELPAGHLPPEM